MIIKFKKKNMNFSSKSNFIALVELGDVNACLGLTCSERSTKATREFLPSEVRKATTDQVTVQVPTFFSPVVVHKQRCFIRIVCEDDFQELLLSCLAWAIETNTRMQAISILRFLSTFIQGIGISIITDQLTKFVHSEFVVACS